MKSLNCLARTGFIGAILSMATSAVIATAAPPVITNYTNQFGTTRDYLDIVEASMEGNPFGAPTILGDTLLFTPENFFSEADFALGGSDITDSQLRFTIDAHPGQIIDTIYFAESGVYTLLGGGVPGGFAYASVGTPIFYHVRQIDGVDVNGPKGSVNMSFAPSGGVFFLNVEGPGVNVAWEGDLLLDIAAIIGADPNFEGSATLVEITLDNSLGTFNSPYQDGEGGQEDAYYASIRKNRLRITVPESRSAIWIAVMLLGAACVLPWRRFSTVGKSAA